MTPIRPSRPAALVRIPATVVALLGLLAAVVGVAAIRSQRVHDLLVIVATAGPTLLACGAIGAVAAIVARRPILAICCTLAVLAVLAGTWTYIPLYRANPARRCRVLSVRAGPADQYLHGSRLPDFAGNLVRDERIDVVTIEELTPDAVDRLRRAGFEDTSPHRLLDPRPGGGGAAEVTFSAVGP